jgi:hypothetical protein
MTYHNYLHVESILKDECEGLLDGHCVITAKLDGTNASVWYTPENGVFHAGSRNRELRLDKDNAGFMNWFTSNDDDCEEVRLIKDMLVENPHYQIFGEWGVGKVGAIKNYVDTAKGTLWIFDIYDLVNEKYFSYNDMMDILSFYSLDKYAVPLIAEIDNPTMEQIQEMAENNTCLTDGTIGEGVVIKREDFVNKYGRYTVGKYVRPQFKDRTRKEKPVLKPGEIEEAFVDKYLTIAELDKAKAKICAANEVEEFDCRNGKMVGMFMNLIWKDTLEENIVDFAKKMKNPKIDLALLNVAIKTKGKEYLGL